MFFLICKGEKIISPLQIKIPIGEISNIILGFMDAIRMLIDKILRILNGKVTFQLFLDEKKGCKPLKSSEKALRLTHPLNHKHRILIFQSQMKNLFCQYC